MKSDSVFVLPLMGPIAVLPDLPDALPDEVSAQDFGLFMQDLPPPAPQFPDQDAIAPPPDDAPSDAEGMDITVVEATPPAIAHSAPDKPAPTAMDDPPDPIAPHVPQARMPADMSPPGQTGPHDALPRPDVAPVPPAAQLPPVLAAAMPAAQVAASGVLAMQPALSTPMKPHKNVAAREGTTQTLTPSFAPRSGTPEAAISAAVPAMNMAPNPPISHPQPKPGGTLAAPAQSVMPELAHAIPQTEPDAPAQQGLPPVHQLDVKPMASAPHNTADLASAREVTRQITAHLTPLEPGTTEISLSPEELGKLRMSVTTREGAVTLVITAERPETAELMRRNADQMLQDFRTAGMGNLNLSFQDRAPERQNSAGVWTQITDDADTPIAAPNQTIANQAIIQSDHLDLRL